MRRKELLITIIFVCLFISVILLVIARIYTNQKFDMQTSSHENVEIARKRDHLKREDDSDMNNLRQQISFLQKEMKRLKDRLQSTGYPRHYCTLIKVYYNSRLLFTSRKDPVNRMATVKYKNYRERKRILVTGGSGFVGSHLVDRLMSDGHEVIALDNHFTGRKKNVEHWIGHPNFELVYHDVVNPFYVEVDQIYHLASPASPPHYMYNPVKTVKTNFVGTMNMLGLARRTKARVLLASTSEVYGDPEVHPQAETYWGHVNPIGPRACYDEGKRVAETLMFAYNKQEKVDVRIARIFNTYGPRMHMNDGRVVSNFILQSLEGKPIKIYGSGNQTRSFQYVTDLVDGLIALMNSNVSLPVNLGNPLEHTIYEFATIIRGLIYNGTKIVNVEKVVDDPQRRRPDIKRAESLLKWRPRVSLAEGLTLTIEYFRKELAENHIDILHPDSPT